MCHNQNNKRGFPYACASWWSHVLAFYQPHRNLFGKTALQGHDGSFGSLGLCHGWKCSRSNDRIGGDRSVAAGGRASAWRLYAHRRNCFGGNRVSFNVQGISREEARTDRRAAIHRGIRKARYIIRRGCHGGRYPSSDRTGHSTGRTGCCTVADF
jgi:hypothetical protein